MRRAAIALLALVAPLSFTASAQNRDHPGLVFADKLGWVTPADAAAKGCFEYQRRWLPTSLQTKLAVWEKEDKRSADWASAWKIESKHYRIVSDAPHFIVESELIPFLDALYDVYTDVFRKDFGLSGKGANKKLIRIHNGYESYAKNEADGDGPPPRTSPGFIVNGSELAVYYEDTEPALFYATVFHEGAHQFVRAMLPGASLPLWLDEGLATYFEGCSYSRATRKITVEHFPYDRIAHAKELLRAAPEGDAGLAEKLFMNVPDNRFEAEQYALAWSFIYYVTHMEDAKNREKFSKFLRATNGTGAKSIPAVFEETTHLKLAEIQKGWRDFVLALPQPALPEHVFLGVKGNDDPAADVRTDDIVWSIGDVEVFDAKTFETAWESRSKERPTRLVVVRRSPAPPPLDFRETFVTALVKPGSAIALEAKATAPREFCLRD